MDKHINTSPKAIGLLIATFSFLAVAGCSAIKNESHKLTDIDPTLKLTRQDYQNMNAPKASGSRPPEPAELTIEKGAPPIPQLADILAAPRPPQIGETQLVSLSVTDDVPLKDVLLELAKLADVDIELDAGISGGISFIAKEKPFNEVIDRVANLADLRYSMKNGVLRVERDTPFIKSYPIDFINLDRESDTTLSLSTNVLSSSTTGSGGGSSSAVSNGFTSSVKYKNKSDLWDSLQTGIDQILAYQPVQKVSSTTLQAETDTNSLIPAATGGNGAAPQPADNQANAAARTSAAGGTGATGATGTNSKKEYTINKQAGVLTLNATKKQHDLVDLFLSKLKSNATSQVLIEAKILEVNLNETYKTGINWSQLGNQVAGGVTFNTLGNGLSTASTQTNNLGTISVTTGDFSSLVSLVETFGAARTLSSPRLHAINNQPSTLTFATNYVYFDTKVTQQQTTSTTGSSTTSAPTITATAQTVPIGIIMSIMPSIDLENNEVTLSVHPTLSSLAGTVKDPSVAYLNVAGVENNVPQVQVRDLDSTVRMRSGETMIIGGIMKQGSDNTDTGLPFASKMPLVGNLFKSVSRTSDNQELVILIKATIVDSRGNVGKVDRDLLHKFSSDPRPISF